MAESVKKPSLGELVEAERLISYLEARDARNATIEPYSDHIVFREGWARNSSTLFGWQVACAGSGRAKD